MFEKADADKDGLINQKDIINLITYDYEAMWRDIDDEGRLALKPYITEIANGSIRKIRGMNVDVMQQNIDWVEFKNFRQHLKREKEELELMMEARLVEQRKQELDDI